MHSFTDSKGRDWVLAINVASILRVRARMPDPEDDNKGFDIQALGEDSLKPLAALLANPAKLAAVLWILCDEQAKGHGVSEDDFYAEIFGETLDAAGEAFTQAFFSFGRKAMRVMGPKIVAKGKAVKDAVMKQVEAQLDAVDPESEAAKLIASSGESPAASASTPDPEPSAS